MARQALTRNATNRTCAWSSRSLARPPPATTQKPWFRSNTPNQTSKINPTPNDHGANTPHPTHRNLCFCKSISPACCSKAVINNQQPWPLSRQQQSIATATPHHSAFSGAALHLCRSTHTLLSPYDVMSPSKTTLQKSLYDLTIESTTQQIQKDDEMWKSRLAEIPKRYKKEFTALETQLKNAQVQ